MTTSETKYRSGSVFEPAFATNPDPVTNPKPEKDLKKHPEKDSEKL
jgi:hypothetical protein